MDQLLLLLLQFLDFCVFFFIGRIGGAVMAEVRMQLKHGDAWVMVVWRIVADGVEMRDIELVNCSHG
jgi:hypothetical protein